MSRVALLAVLLVACGTPGTPPPPSGPRLDVPERVHDAGKVDQGITLHHDFVVRNGGSTPLAIDAKPG